MRTPGRYRGALAQQVIAERLRSKNPSLSEVSDIKSVMQSHGESTEHQKAVGAWLCDYAEHRQPFDEIKHRHTLNEVGDVAEGRYAWKIDRGRGGINF